MTADRLLIPASVLGDRLRLLGGWVGVAHIDGIGDYVLTGPSLLRPGHFMGQWGSYAADRFSLDARRHLVRAHVVDALAAGVKCVDLCGHGGPGSAPVSEGCVGCTGRFGKAWITPPYDVFWQLHRHGFTPTISADDSAGLCACSVARVRAGSEPVRGILDRWAPEPWHIVAGDMGQTMIPTRRYVAGWPRLYSFRPCIVGPAGWRLDVTARRPSGSSPMECLSGPEIAEPGMSAADAAAVAHGFALRNPDGTLTLPWPDEVSP